MYEFHFFFYISHVVHTVIWRTEVQSSSNE